MANAEMILRFIEARGRLEQGWCQEFMHRKHDDGNREWCVIGALRGTGMNLLDGLSVIHKIIGPISIVGWNDTPGRTQQEVLEVVDRAIALLMKEGAAEVAETREELVPA